MVTKYDIHSCGHTMSEGTPDALAQRPHARQLSRLVVLWFVSGADLSRLFMDIVEQS